MALADGERLDRRRWVATDAGDPSGDGFARLRAREGGRRTRARAIGAALALAAAVLVGGLLMPRPEHGAWEGARLATAAHEATVMLADGSRIEAAPQSEVARAAAPQGQTQFEVLRGSATFEVAPQGRGAFIVRAAEVEVRVVGTRFRVARERDGAADEIEVSVERGQVEVRAGNEVRSLHAGERWTHRHSEEIGTGEPAAEPPAAAVVAAEAAPPEVASSAERGARSPRERVPDAESLFEEARRARREGRAADAAALCEMLLSAHPHDARAPLAALELGRLRMDSLGDPAGAARAFEQALRSSASSPLREETAARLVRAHDAAGAAGACRDARRRYLEEWPQGAYASDVARRCPE